MNYVISLIISLLLLNVILLIYLLAWKQVHQKRERLKDQLRNKLSIVMAEIIDGKLEEIPLSFKRNSLFFEVLEETISQYLHVLRDEEIAWRLKSISQSELFHIYIKRLKSQKWSIRMNVLYHIEEFEMDLLKDDIWKYYQSHRSSVEEKYQIIRTLARLNDQRLVEQIKHSPNWPYFLLKECFRRFDFSTCKKLIYKDLEGLAEEVQVALLDVAIESKDSSLSSLFDELLFSDSQEVRICALKAIIEFEQTAKEEEIIRFYHSDFWVERMMFARVAGQLKRNRYSSPLVTLLSDRSWWVRQSAAEALAEYKDGLFILEHVYKTNEDQFARDTAYQWLGEAVEV